MGLDSAYYPDRKIKRKELEEFLVLLGYKLLPKSNMNKELKSTSFSYFSSQPYESFQGVGFTVMTEDTSKLIAYGRNTIFLNKADNDFHNYTLRKLKERFGGYFISDYGKNRYFPFSGAGKTKDELGCYAEAGRAVDQLKKIYFFENIIKDWKAPVQKEDFVWMNFFHPHVIFSNLAVVFILSVIESYFRNTYISLLSFSSQKASILKASKIRTSDLIEVSKGEMTIEEAFANGLSFQNASAICENYDRLDRDLGVSQLINRENVRRKENFFLFIQRIAELRHENVHRNTQSLGYDLEDVRRDAKFCDRMIRKVYENIVVKKRWDSERYF